MNGAITRVLPELDVDIDDRGARVDDRHAGEHVPVEDPALRDLADLGELAAVVDPRLSSRIGQHVGAHDVHRPRASTGSTSGR